MGLAPERSAKRARLSHSPRKPTPRNAGGKGKDAADEDAFMAELLAGIDASAFDAPPSSAPSQVRPSPRSTKPEIRPPANASPPKPNHLKTSPRKTGTPRAKPHFRPEEKARPRTDDLDVILGLKSPGPRNVKAEREALAHLPPNVNLDAAGRPKIERGIKPKIKTPSKTLVDLTPNSSQGSQPERKPLAQPLGKPLVPLHSTTSLAVQPPASPQILPDLVECIPGSQDDYDGDWDLDALASLDDKVFEEPIRYPILNPAVPPPPAGYSATPWARCTVESVHEGILAELPEDEYDEGFGWGKSLVVITPTGRRLVQLKERWADLRLRPGDIVNVVSPVLDDTSTRPIAITFKDTSSYLIAHPDILVTMTSIANAMPCVRKPLLNQLVRLPESLSKPMIYGNILHGLLQESLSDQTFDAPSTRRRVGTDLAKDERRLEVWGAGLDPGAVANDLGRNAEDAFASFGRRWIGSEPKMEGNVITARDETVGTVAINGLHDVEEDIWSPKWGLKGKVDASVQAVLERDGQRLEVVAPMEIKTGRAIGGVQHRAQTLLYTLLMEDRYGLPVPAGLLYYSQRDSIVLVEAKANEVRALVQTRNELAEWMMRERRNVEDETPFLPATVNEQRECKNCYASDVCMLYRKANDTVPALDDDPIGDVYDDKTAHLTDQHAAFFKHWERLLTLEEQDTVRLRAQLWTMTAHERERKGRCFADMVMVKEEIEGGQGRALSKINRYMYTFSRGDLKAGSLLTGHIAKNDAVSLSLEPDLLYLARGFVASLTSDTVTITVQNKLDIDVKLKRVRSTAAQIFRIDKDELTSGMTRMRGNLAHLFVKEGDSKRRSLVVELCTPRFDSTLDPKPFEIPAHLNEDQRGAMAKVLTAKDYALILGMPGTGKTTTVAEIIRAIVARGQTVLLTSYTHSAVDTIVSKLIGADFGVLRIGNAEKVHPDVRHLTLEALGPADTLDEFEDRLMLPPVVATTCLSIEHPLFKRRKFDYCIVDEASQITLPTCIGPLRNADKFVLVGDHFQLPPIVRKEAARVGGLDVSLFRRLSDAHPAAVATLAAQYRMNEDIMLLSNRLIYEDRLRCGSEAVAKQALVLPQRKTCAEICGEAICDDSCWAQILMSEDRKAVLVDTDLVPARETRAGDLVQNPTEAGLVYTLARALVASGTPASDIAVITPYRQQIKLIQRVFQGATDISLDGVEVLTADKAQGRDKAVVLVSLVRSNDTGNIGNLLRDWRRINVSFTRAKAKLVIFGSVGTLSSDRLMADFVKLMEEREWVLRLPEGADGLHGEITGVKDEEEDGVEEGEGEEKKKRKGVVGARMLEKRPFVKELLEGED